MQVVDVCIEASSHSFSLICIPFPNRIYSNALKSSMDTLDFPPLQWKTIFVTFCLLWSCCGNVPQEDFVPYCTSFRNDAIDIKSDKTNNSTHLYHSMFYNHKSKRVEANISWEHAMDMVQKTRYILEIMELESDQKLARCINIDVHKESGYFYGKHDFPHEVSVKCFQLRTYPNERCSVTVWQIRTENCTCHSVGTERDTAECLRQCSTQLLTRNRLAVLDDYHFISDACAYWSKTRYPTLDLTMKHTPHTGLTATLSAVNLNPYTDVSIALFATDSPRFPIFEDFKSQTLSTQPNSFRFTRHLDYQTNSTFYMVIYYYCNGRNKKETASYMSQEVYINYENPSTDSSLMLNKEESEADRRRYHIILGTLVVLSCISVGILIASIMFYKTTCGCDTSNSSKDVHGDTRLEVPNNETMGLGENVTQPTTKLKPGNRKMIFGVDGSVEFQEVKYELKLK